MSRGVQASRKLGQCWTENLLQQRFFISHSSEGKGDRDTNVVHSLKDRENLQKILGRKVDLAVRGERIAHQKLHNAEAEAKNWEKRNSDFGCQEIHQ